LLHAQSHDSAAVVPIILFQALRRPTMTFRTISNPAASGVQTSGCEARNQKVER
jgi:hypothetical protein